MQQSFKHTVVLSSLINMIVYNLILENKEALIRHVVISSI